MLECVVNVSEGQDSAVLDALVAAVETAAPGTFLDLHSDADHHRSVFTMLGERAPRVLATAAVSCLDMNAHSGVHPRLGVVDVVPFVPLDDATIHDAIHARNNFAEWAAEELNVPVFLYGPERSLPDVRRHAWKDLMPDIGPTQPHRSAGAICVGARELLVAWNVWLSGISLAATREIAAAVRTHDIRTLGLQVGDYTQVSVNLVNPLTTGPDIAFEAIAERSHRAGATVVRSELVGLAPGAMVRSIDPQRWADLDLDEERTIESRRARARDRQ